MRLFPLSSFLFPLLFLPLVTNAAAVCKPDTYTCMCTYHDSANGEGYDDVGSENVADCVNTCNAYALSGDVNWLLICTDTGGDDASVGSGTITQSSATATSEDVSGGTATSPIIPNLNVDIPGLSFEGGLTYDKEGNLNINYLATYVDALYKFLMVAMTIVAVLMLMVGGFQYILARGHADAVKKAKLRIVNAVTGMVLLMSAYTIAFLIDPKAVKFETLKIKTVPYVATADLEDFTGYSAASTSVDSANVTQLTSGGDTHLIAAVKSGDTFVGKEVLAALTAAAEKFYDASGKENPGHALNILITSGSRTKEKQATLFYENCLEKNGYCHPDTCNIDGDNKTVISKVNGKWVVAGAYAGKTKSEIVAALAANGDGRNCPHTNNLAVDLWPEGEGTDFTFNVASQNLMTTTLFANGFCRIPNEPWHFELAGKGSSSCTTTTFTDSSYRKGGTVYSTVLCKTWDAYNNCCEVPLTSSAPPTTMCE